MTTGVRLTDKESSAIVQSLVGIRLDPTAKVTPINIVDFVEQLLAGGVGEAIDGLGLANATVAAKISKAALDAVLPNFTAGDVGIVYSGVERGIYTHSGSAWVFERELPEDRAATSATLSDLARVLSELARDIAAGYASDAVSQGNVPIYATAVGMGGISVPAGVTALRTNGYAAAGDGGAALYKKVVSEPSHPGKFQSSDGAWWEIADVHVKPEARGYRSRKMQDIAAAMAAGSAIKIACYGDSTTDGTATTGWVANPVSGSGVPNGTTDHNVDAPNAWPAWLRTILGQMYPANASISVWNCGYSGRRMDDGWADTNYDRAVVDHPAYGNPDLCFVAFGLNDVQGGSTATIVANHIAETRKLVRRLQLRGTVPVLLTCDATWGTGSRNRTEVSEQIDAAKFALARELGIEIIDLNQDMRQWLTRNKQGYTYSSVQTDTLHVGDRGHYFKAGAVARHLFKDIVSYRQGDVQRVSVLDARNRTLGTIVASTVLNEDGASIGFSSNAFGAGATMQDFWVWNDSIDGALVYRGISNERYSSAGYANAPAILGTDTVAGTVSAFNPGSVSFGSAATGYVGSDIPFICGYLPYGLVRVRYRLGDAAGLYMGNFKLCPHPRTGRQKNALKHIGAYRSRFVAGADALDLLPEASDLSNVFSIMNSPGSAVDILADVDLPVNCGLVLAHNQAWGEAGQVAGDKTMFVLYRSASNTVSLRLAKTVNGVITLGTALATGTLASTADAQKIRVNISRAADVFTYSVFEDWASTSAILTYLRTGGSGHFCVAAGAVGGFLYINGSTANALLRTLLIA